MKRPRPLAADDVRAIEVGLEFLKQARACFKSARATRAYRATLRAIKSADGAARHALNLSVAESRLPEGGDQ